MVSTNVDPASPRIHFHVLYLMEWRVAANYHRRGDGGRLNVFAPFSLSSRTFYTTVPWVYGRFISVPSLFIVVYDPDFYNRSSD